MAGATPGLGGCGPGRVRDLQEFRRNPGTRITPVLGQKNRKAYPGIRARQALAVMARPCSPGAPSSETAPICWMRTIGLAAPSACELCHFEKNLSASFEALRQKTRQLPRVIRIVQQDRRAKNP